VLYIDAHQYSLIPHNHSSLPRSNQVEAPLLRTQPPFAIIFREPLRGGVPGSARSRVDGGSSGQKKEKRGSGGSYLLIVVDLVDHLEHKKRLLSLKERSKNGEPINPGVRRCRGRLEGRYGGMR
jgi:hypothetical protein